MRRQTNVRNIFPRNSFIFVDILRFTPFFTKYEEKTKGETQRQKKLICEKLLLDQV